MCWIVSLSSAISKTNRLQRKWKAFSEMQAGVKFDFICTLFIWGKCTTSPIVKRARMWQTWSYTRIKGFPISFVDRISEELLLNASSLKARFPISYADSFAAALAKVNRVPLLSGDPEFESLQKNEELEMAWLRSVPPFIEK